MGLAAVFIGTMSLFLACLQIGIATEAEYQTMERLKEVPDGWTMERKPSPSKVTKSSLGTY